MPPRHRESWTTRLTGKSQAVLPSLERPRGARLWVCSRLCWPALWPEHAACNWLKRASVRGPASHKTCPCSSSCSHLFPVFSFCFISLFFFLSLTTYVGLLVFRSFCVYLYDPFCISFFFFSSVMYLFFSVLSFVVSP